MAEDFTGQSIGTYRVEERIGAGGMGEVYRAYDAKLDRPVAIKLIDRKGGIDDHGLQRFRAEARAISALNHPNILVIHDIGDVSGRPYMVTEYVDGVTLRERLAAGPLPVREVIAIATQVASALASAHGRGIVHRDIKLDNIMLRSDGYVKVLDFGLAKLASVDEESGDSPTLQTEAGLIVGTPEYMSPEQATGRHVDFRSDQFSLGVVLYELVAGVSPFRRTSRVQSAAAVIGDAFEPLSRLCPNLPPPFRWVVERCLAKRPEDRFASTGDLHRDITTIHERISDVRAQPPTLPPSNLPAPGTALIGRETEVAAVRELVLRPGVRWVTVTGPGGVGKTRLIAHVARELSSHFDNAVYFVPLASVSDPILVSSAIAQAFDVRPIGAESSLTALTRHLRLLTTPVLLVLDSFEHAAAAAVDVLTMLEASETLKALVSSRSVMNVTAEHEYRLHPLAVPSRQQTRRGAEHVAAIPAVALFVERARAARPGFTLTADNAAAVAETCEALDGLPLAIELAAARIKLMSPEALASRIGGKRLSLAGGARDLPTRQQTLRATIDWGYELLSAAEQRLFRRLAVFSGGWTLEAAEAVADAREDLGVDVFDGLSSLVDKSLARPIEGDTEDPRFTMLATIREYALERLQEAGEETNTRQAHAAYCLVLAEETPKDAISQTRWLTMCDVEHGNLRSAIEFLIASRKREWAMRLAAALLPYWQARAFLVEGHDALSRALALASDTEISPSRARALFALGTICHPMGNEKGTEQLAMQALEVFRALGDRHGQAVALNAIGLARHTMKQHGTARRDFEEVLALWRSLGDRQSVVRTLVNLASVASDEGDLAGAVTLFREARAESERIRDEVSVAWNMNCEAQVERLHGNAESARELYKDALARFVRLQDGWGEGDSLLALGELEGEAGRRDAALELLTQAQRVFDRVGEVRGNIRLVEGLSRLAAIEGNAREALILAGAAAASRQTVNAPLIVSQRERSEKALEDIRKRLAPQDAAAAWMEGWSLSLDDALRRGLRQQ
jgi:predicted ATPase